MLTEFRGTPLRPAWPQYLLWGYTAGLALTHIFLQATGAIYLLLLLWLIASGQHRRFQTIHWLLIAYALSAILAFWIAGHSLKQHSSLLSQLVLLGLIPLSLWQEDSGYPALRPWSRWLVGLALLACLAGVYHHFQGMDRVKGFFGSYFTIAVLLVCTIPISCGMLLSGKLDWRRAYYLPVLGLQLLTLWWTYTRSAFLGLFIGMGVFALALFLRDIRSPKRERRAILARWGILLALPAILLSLMLTAADPRINPFYKAPPEAATEIVPGQDFSSGRKAIIIDALRITSGEIRQGNYSKLIFGHGLSSRKRMVEGYISSWESDFLQIFMNQGLIGLLLAMGIYAGFIRAIWHGLRSPDLLLTGLAAAGIGYSVMSFFTLQITAFNSAGIFALLYAFLHTSSPRRQNQ